METIKTKICLIDDHHIVRQGLKELLYKMKNFEVVAEFDSGTTFLDALPLEVDVDVFILDYMMPKTNGIEVLKTLEKTDYNFKVLLLTQHFEEQLINDAYHHGARGVLHKNCTAQELQTVIQNIMQFGFNNITEILRRIKNYESPITPNLPKIELNHKELEFLKHVCAEQEYTYEQIAHLMQISVKSVEVLRASFFEKFQIKSKPGLVLFSFKNKLTAPFI